MDKKICPKAKECKKRCITHHNVPHIHNEECDFDNCIEWTNCGFCVTYVESSPEPSMPLAPCMTLPDVTAEDCEACRQQVRKDFAACVEVELSLSCCMSDDAIKEVLRLAHLRVMAGER